MDTVMLKVTFCNFANVPYKVKFFHPTCRLNEFRTGDSKMGNSDDASLVIELVEEWRDLPPAEGTGGDSGASPRKSTDWNSPLFEGEF
jgi:hypothetical protein